MTCLHQLEEGWYNTSVVPGFAFTAHLSLCGPALCCTLSSGIYHQATLMAEGNESEGQINICITRGMDIKVVCLKTLRYQHFGQAKPISSINLRQYSQQKRVPLDGEMEEELSKRGRWNLWSGKQYGVEQNPIIGKKICCLLPK